MRTIETGSGVFQISDRGVSAQTIAFASIPMIDLALMDASIDERQTFVEELRHICATVGFFYVKNHGVSQSLIDQMFAQSQQFFALPLDQKMQIHISKSAHHRGYVPLLEETVDPTAKPDLHEALDFSLELPLDDPDVQAGKLLYGPNLYPQELPEFRAIFDCYYNALYQLGQRIFRALALALDLPEQFFDSKITKPLAQLRLLYYPPQTTAIDPDQIGTGAHTDYECFTILAQDQVAGLQVLNSAGEWIAAPPIPGTFIVNIGDLMARWTNGRFVSNLHRAVNCSGRERYAIPYFFGPNYDTVIDVLPSCGHVASAKYQPVKAGEHLSKRYDATFAYRAN